MPRKLLKLKTFETFELDSLFHFFIARRKNESINRFLKVSMLVSEWGKLKN